MVSLRDFASRMDARAGKLAEQSHKRAIRVATAILRDLVYRTPVDTSTALSNWQVGIGTPVASEIFPYYFGTKGSTRAPSAQAAYAAGVAKLQSKKPGETIYISNLTDYIKQLNEGSSLQAPAGFVERAVLVGRKTK